MQLKKMCFGTLLNLMYQSRGSNVTYKSICSAVFSAYGCDNMEHRDSSLPGHLKTGHDNVPPDVINAVRDISFEDAIESFEANVTCLIANEKGFIYSIKAVLTEDNIADDTLIGYVTGYEKKSILDNCKFQMAPLLASLFKYAILDVTNKDCADNLKDFGKNYLSSVDTSKQLFIDPLTASKSDDDYTVAPLQRTMTDGTFGRTFKKVSSVVVSGATHPSTADIYCADLRNGKLSFKQVKEFLADNIGTYVFSRATINRYTDMHKPIGALGTQALIQFQKAYGQNAESVLGELMLYLFLEQELNAPKIMSKIEFSQHGGLVSKSDGIHLYATTEFGRPFNQLVFGASNIEGSITGAIDRAFERIIDIEENADIEFSTIENTSQYLVFDNATNEYLRDIMIPRKHYSRKPDMAFGMFLGYSLVVDPPEPDSAKYRIAAEKQLKADIEEAKSYISEKIKNNNLEGYSFYCYVLPFNDAPNERTSLIDEMLEGR